MEIPHSPNFAQAMYGFREFGAEIVPYHEIKDIYNDVTRDDIVLDYIDQCTSVFYKFGVEPKIPDYPDQLKAYMGRKVWKDTINSIAADESKWSAGYFVKPTRDKAFTGKIIRNISDLIGCGSCYKNVKAFNKFVKVRGYSIEADRDEGRVSFKQKLPEMKEKAAEQTKANPVAENAKKKAQEIA